MPSVSGDLCPHSDLAHEEKCSLTNIAAAAKSLQSCPTQCDLIDSSPTGSPVPGILQARTLEWVAISFSNAWKWKVKVKSLSHVQLFTTPWTAAYQAPLYVGFSRQEYWSGCHRLLWMITWVHIKMYTIFTLYGCISFEEHIAALIKKVHVWGRRTGVGMGNEDWRGL